MSIIGLEIQERHDRERTEAEARSRRSFVAALEWADRSGFDESQRLLAASRAVILRGIRPEVSRSEVLEGCQRLYPEVFPR